MKLGIGTAQFGLNYGISNTGGKTSLEEAKRILELADLKGVIVIDTAPAYGDSEEVIGKVLPSQNNFNIVTKTPHFNTQIMTNDDVNLLESTFKKSLIKLNQSSIYGFLIHNANDILKENGHLLMEKMLLLKEAKLVEKVGFSVYTSQQIDNIINNYNYNIDIIQLPINVFDQRLIQSGHLTKLKEKGIEIHARSVFLQGLLLMNLEDMPSKLQSIKPHLKKYYQFISKHKLSKNQAALCFVNNINEIDYIVVGINNCKQLQQNILKLKECKLSDKNHFRAFAFNDNKILDPSQWNSG